MFVPIELDEAEPQLGRRGLIRKGSAVLTKMEEHGAIDTTFYTEKVHATDPARGIKAVAGEAAWGGDGFVALFDLATAKLEWIAFFDFANPFDEVELTDHAVISRNNLGETWSFPLADPAGVAIVGAAKHPSASKHGH